MDFRFTKEQEMLQREIRKFAEEKLEPIAAEVDELDEVSKRVTKEASMAKIYATEMAWRVVDQALQIHGRYGVLRGSTTERLYREIRQPRVYEGTSEIQRLVISRHILGN